MMPNRKVEYRISIRQNTYTVSLYYSI